MHISYLLRYARGTYHRPAASQRSNILNFIAHTLVLDSIEIVVQNDYSRKRLT